MIGNNQYYSQCWLGIMSKQVYEYFAAFLVSDRFYKWYSKSVFPYTHANTNLSAVGLTSGWSCDRNCVYVDHIIAKFDN